MKRLVVMFVVLSCGSGCAELVANMKAELKQSSKISVEEVNETKGKNDYAAMEALCLQRKRSYESGALLAACNGALEMVVAKKDMDLLQKICNGSGKYRNWYKNRGACKAKQEMQASAGSKELESATCSTLVSAWEKAKGTLTNRYNTTAASRNAAFQSTAIRLIKCGNWDYVWEKMVHWGSAKGLGASLLTALNSKGYDLEKEMLSYLERHKANPFSFKHGSYALNHYVSFLKREQKFSRCKAYIPYADKMSDGVFGNFNWYFREANCSAAVKIIPKRLLSDRSGTRQGACRTLAKFGTKKHLKKLKVLATTDPYHKVKEERRNGRIWAMKVYPVRETCRAAMGKIQLRH